jgi:hypothetical protein
MDPIDTNLDLELLAALADGRLSGEERARAVRMVADSDEALELFANTVREQQVPDVKVTSITSARGWRQWKVVLPVAVAAALAVVMVPRLAGPSKQAGLANEYAMELAENPRFAGGLRDGWEQRGWAVTRGGTRSRTPGVPKVESGLAFRLGVRTVDLQVALRRGDTALAGRMAGDVLETLRAVEFTDVVAASYTELKSKLAVDPVARSLDHASAADRELADLLASPSSGFGSWVAAADVAAQMHDAACLESRHGTRFIQSALPAGSLTTEDVEALRSIDARVSQSGGANDRALDDVHAILQTVIRRRGS